MTDKLGDTLYFDFSTHNPLTAAVQDADSTPTAEVFEDATDTPIETPTVTKRTGKTGSYRIPVTATGGGGYEVGKSYNVYAIATVGSIADRLPVGRFTLDGKRVSDLNDIAAGAAMTLTGAYDPAKTAAPETGGNVAAIKAKTDTLPATPANEATLTTITGIVTETRRIVKNKLTENKTTSELELWDDAGSTIIMRWPLTDKDGASIVLTGTGPANRGVPT